MAVLSRIRDAASPATGWVLVQDHVTVQGTTRSGNQDNVWTRVRSCRGIISILVILEAAGDVHTLNLKAAEIRAFMAELDRSILPAVEKARALG